MQGGQLLEHVRVGGGGLGRGAANDGQVELAEQHVGQLLGRADVERRAGHGVDLRLEGLDRDGHFLSQLAQIVSVDAYAAGLDPRQHVRQR